MAIVPACECPDRTLCGLQVLFLSASEEINRQPDVYWASVMDIARRNNLSRIIRCSQIMGRNDTDDLSAAQILYPCMQCADIFFLKVRQAARTPPVQARRGSLHLQRPRGPSQPLTRWLPCALWCRGCACLHSPAGATHARQQRSAMAPQVRCRPSLALVS